MLISYNENDVQDNKRETLFVFVQYLCLFFDKYQLKCSESFINKIFYFYKCLSLYIIYIE